MTWGSAPRVAISVAGGMAWAYHTTDCIAQSIATLSTLLQNELAVQEQAAEM
jgi:hypothetical protein